MSPTIHVYEIKLNYLHICTQSVSKIIINKELHIVPFWEEYVECISYLGECVQPMHPMVDNYCCS
jgi:hypothetical protein